MRKLLALALITFFEGVRNRSVYGIALFALFIFGLNISVAGFFMRDVGKVTIDMNLSALSIAGLLLVFFVVVNLIAKDIDRKTIHLVLSKPISRVQYIWGKYFGFLAFLILSMIVLSAISCLTIWLVKFLYSGYFGQFSWIIFFVASFFVFIKIAVLVAVIVFFSTVTSNSFITLIFSFFTFVVGSMIEEVLFYLQSSFAIQEIAISESLRRVIEIVSYVVPNLAVFDFKTAAAHGVMPGWQQLVHSLGYGSVYIVVLLMLSSIIFCRREFN